MREVYCDVSSSAFILYGGFAYVLWLEWAFYACVVHCLAHVAIDVF